MTEQLTHYDTMLDKLSELVQCGNVWGDDEQDLLNFIEELRKEVATCQNNI